MLTDIIVEETKDILTVACHWNRRHRMRKIKRICTSRSRRNEGRIAYLFLAPSLAGTAVFVLLLFMEVGEAILRQDGRRGFAGLENFAQVLGKPGVLPLAMRNTLRFMVWCIPSLMGVSLLTAVLVRVAADRERPV